MESLRCLLAWLGWWCRHYFVTVKRPGWRGSRHDIGAQMLHSQAPRWEEQRASSLLTAREVIERLELETIAKLLQHPLPVEEAELMRWLIDENMVTPDSDGCYITNFGAIAAAKGGVRYFV
jgi:ATP-dependent DNA helicase RecG